MKQDSKQFNNYGTGADMWHDTALNYGIDEAVTICGNYISMNLKRKLSEVEQTFSRELFCAMYEAMANTANPFKIVYPYTLEEADKQWASYYYHMSRNINKACSRAIAKTINNSCYETNFYNLECAAYVVLLKYGFNRIGAILSHQIQKCGSDGRYSQVNKQWAKRFILPDRAFDDAFINVHAILVDGFTDYVRKLYIDMDAERFALPGYEEHGEFVHGYEINRAVMIEHDTGYALAHNPNAVEPYVCWQFKVHNGERHYNWGVYGSEKTALDSFNARVFIHSDAESEDCNG